MTFSPQLSATALAVYVALAGTAAAQSPLVELGRTSGRIDSGSIGTGGPNGGYHFQWETRIEPVLPAIGNLVSRAWSDTNGGAGDPNVIHRILFDKERRVYFGYDVRFEPLPLPERSSRLTFRPLTMTPKKAEQVLGPDAGTWTMIPAPPFPAPRTIATGEVLEVPLLTNQAWAQRLVEYVTIQDERREGFRALEVAPREFAYAPGAPRDFTVEDVELRLSRPTITARTSTATGGSGRHRQLEGDVTGSVLWIYVPNRGRYLLSLQPRAALGFQKAGDVRGSTMRFTDGATTYNLGSAARIAPGQSAFNLYVLFQKDWKPTYPHANLDTFHIGAVERDEDLR
jgi:hypothetical protein